MKYQKPKVLIYDEKIMNEILECVSKHNRLKGIE